MVSDNMNISIDLVIDPIVQSILVNPNKVMPGFSSPVVKLEPVINW